MDSNIFFSFFSTLVDLSHNQNLIFEYGRLWISAPKFLCCSDDTRWTLACDDFSSRRKGILSNCVNRLIEGIINKAKAYGRIEGYREPSATRIFNTHYFFIPYEVKVVYFTRWYHRPNSLEIDHFMNVFNANRYNTRSAVWCLSSDHWASYL